MISPTGLIEEHFGALKDPRAAYRIEHKLIDIVIITICATICGANDWEAIAEYGRAKQDRLKTWLELPNGIPSSDTFSRVFASINPAQLQKCFMGWMEAVTQVSIDAMGCQKEIAKKLVEQGADYVLALKGNQGDLHADVAQLFSAARTQDFRNIEHQFHSTVSKGHGRIETRRYWTRTYALTKRSLCEL